MVLAIISRDGPGDRACVITSDGECYMQTAYVQTRRNYGIALFAVLAPVAEWWEWETGHAARWHSAVLVD